MVGVGGCAWMNSGWPCMPYIPSSRCQGQLSILIHLLWLLPNSACMSIKSLMQWHYALYALHPDYCWGCHLFRWFGETWNKQHDRGTCFWPTNRGKWYICDCTNACIFLDFHLTIHCDSKQGKLEHSYFHKVVSILNLLSRIWRLIYENQLEAMLSLWGTRSVQLFYLVCSKCYT